MSCTALTARLNTAHLEMAMLYKEQQDRAIADGVKTVLASGGAILLFPLLILASLEGNGEAADSIAALKGEALAINAQLVGRCAA